MDKCNIVLSDLINKCNIKGKVLEYNYDGKYYFSIKIDIRGSNQPFNFILSHLNEYKPVNVNAEFKDYNIKFEVNDVFITSFDNYIIEIKSISKINA